MDEYSQVTQVRTCVGELSHGTGLAFYVSRCIGKVAIRYGTEVNLFFAKTRCSTQDSDSAWSHPTYALREQNARMAYPLAHSFLGLLNFRWFVAYCTHSL